MSRVWDLFMAEWWERQHFGGAVLGMGGRGGFSNAVRGIEAMLI